MVSPYIFYFDTPYGLVEFPITPGKLTITNESNNKTVTLISEGDVNILKSPALIEVSFEARFPTHKYPYSTNPNTISSYLDTFTKLKEEKQPFQFIVTRTNYAASSTGGTNLTMALEDLETVEDADEGDDVLITFKLKQYKEYGVKQISTNSSATTSTSSINRRSNEKASNSETYTVKSGDCLWNISKKQYGDATNWTAIYDNNKSTIETAAKEIGKKNSSSNGHWIYPGTKLELPSKKEIRKETRGHGRSGTF